MAKKMVTNAYKLKEIKFLHMKMNEIIVFYKTYVRPHADYACRIMCAPNEFIMYAEGTQRGVLKSMFAMKIRTPTKLLYALIPIEKIELGNGILAMEFRMKTLKLCEGYYFK